MRIELTAEQIQRLEDGQVVDVADQVAGQLVVVRKEVFEQLQDQIEDWNPKGMKPHLAKMMAEDWSDPEMDVYDQKEYDRT